MVLILRLGKLKWTNREIQLVDCCRSVQTTSVTPALLSHRPFSLHANYFFCKLSPWVWKLSHPLSLSLYGRIKQFYSFSLWWNVCMSKIPVVAALKRYLLCRVFVLFRLVLVRGRSMRTAQRLTVLIVLIR